MKCSFLSLELSSIQVTEWLQIHWVICSTILPILRTSLHFDRRACYFVCPLFPQSHESLLRTLCTCRVVSTTCCIRLHHPSYDLQWSCVHLHLPEWDIVVDTYYHRYCDWQLTDQGWKKWDVCNPRMSVVGTSRYGIRSILCRHIHFPRFLVLLRDFCTISDTHLPNHRCYRCEWYEDVSIDHRWDWVSWVPHPVSTWGCIPW